MKVQYRIAIAVIAIVGAVVLFKALIGNSIVAIFDPAGPVAAQQKNLIELAVLLMLIIVIPVLTLFYTFAWKYRAGNPKAKYDPDQTHKPWKEIMLWFLPAIIVAVLAVITWQTAHALDPYNPLQSANKPLTIEVVALQWKWLFIYPEQNIATVNLIQFPENTPIHFELTADGPISSFWIPQLGSQIYSMAAMETQLNVMASTTGEFTGKNMEINGDGYSGMTFKALSTSQADFDAWVSSVKQSSPTLTTGAYTQLAMPSENNPPSYYSSVQGDLFDTIMMNYMEPSSSQPMQGMQM